MSLVHTLTTLHACYINYTIETLGITRTNNLEDQTQTLEWEKHLKMKQFSMSAKVEATLPRIVQKKNPMTKQWRQLGMMTQKSQIVSHKVVRG